MFRHDACTDVNDLGRCWAFEKMGTNRSVLCQCRNRVNPDPEGLGLCDDHRDEILTW